MKLLYHDDLMFTCELRHVLAKYNQLHGYCCYCLHSHHADLVKLKGILIPVVPLLCSLASKYDLTKSSWRR